MFLFKRYKTIPFKKFKMFPFKTFNLLDAFPVSYPPYSSATVNMSYYKTLLVIKYQIYE